jgi:hypothetical protein
MTGLHGHSMVADRPFLNLMCVYWERIDMAGRHMEEVYRYRPFLWYFAKDVR